MPAEDSVREGQEEGGSLFFRTPGRIFILWLRLLLQVALARRFGVLQMLGSGHNLISLVGIVSPQPTYDRITGKKNMLGA